jgi:hypothetical protein
MQSKAKAAEVERQQRREEARRKKEEEARNAEVRTSGGYVLLDSTDARATDT